MGSIFSKKESKRGGVKTQKTFNIFNISPVLSTFFVGNPFKFLNFLTFPQWEASFRKSKPKRGGAHSVLPLSFFPYISLSLYLCLFVSLSLSLFCLCLSLSVSVSLCLSLSLSLSLFLFFFPSIPSWYVSLSLSF